MAMKTKKERFHVSALNQDLEGEMSREEEEEEGAAPKRTPQLYKPYSGRQNALSGGKTRYTESEKLPKKTHWQHLAPLFNPELTVLESSSCLFCAKTFSTPACSAYVTNPKPLRRKAKKKKKKQMKSQNMRMQSHGTLKTSLMERHGRA